MRLLAFGVNVDQVSARTIMMYTRREDEIMEQRKNLMARAVAEAFGGDDE